MNMRGKEGFTLLEVMVAVALMGVIMTLIWSSSSQTLRSKDRTEARDTIFHSGQVGLRKIADDVSAAFLTKAAAAAGEDAAAAGSAAAQSAGAKRFQTFFIGEDRGEQDSLRFTSLARVRLVKNSKECDQTRIAYAVVPNQEDPKLFDITRTEQPWLAQSTEVEGRSFKLLEGVQSFNIEYYDERKREWTKEWNTTKADDSEKLPMAAKFNIVFPDPDGLDEGIPLSTAVGIEMWQSPIEL